MSKPSPSELTKERNHQVMKNVIAYCRVSTSDQNVNSQLNAIRSYVELQGWRLKDVYLDEGVSGSKDDREALNRLKRDCSKQRRGWDGIVVYKFDRLARSTTHLLECLQLFQKHKIDFISTTEGIDTSTSVGKMVFTFLSAIAEFERSIIQERVISGMDRARKEGVIFGRPRKGFDVDEAIRLKSEGWSLRRIAEKLGVSYGTVNRVLKSVTKTCKMIAV